MEKMIYDENNGLWYELKGDYYFPLLKAPEMNWERIGIWGLRRHDYLRDHKRGIFEGLLASGKLESHLIEVNQTAEVMFSQMVKQYAEKECVTEELKSRDQLAWVGKMNNIQNCVNEVIMNELICM